MFKKILLYVIFALSISISTFANVEYQKKHELLQFTSNGHILGFEKTSLYIATGSHALRIKFTGTEGVMPVSTSDFSNSEKKAQLKEVKYKELWDGITLTYTKNENNIFESTYYLAPNASADNIRLVYNVPLETTENGSLNLKFKTGYMTESPPEAWQEINGEKVPVTVSFKKITTDTIGFKLGQYNPEFTLIIDPVLSWNTFMGSAGSNTCSSLAVDGSGNIYITGQSTGPWSTSSDPVNAHSTGMGWDAFVAKLNGNGNLVWHTFMGCAGDVLPEDSNDIGVDNSGNVYIIGTGYCSWGSPLNPHSGSVDAFVAKLNNNGSLVWNTFIGTSDEDVGYGIAVTGSGDLYITGYSKATWGTPPTFHYGSFEAYAAKLNSSGGLIWNTFMGSAGADYGVDIAINGLSEVYVTGYSNASWGSSPKNAYAGNWDAFVVSLNPANGYRSWHTFMGSAGDPDYGRSITVDDSYNIYVTGRSLATWGTPVNGFQGDTDAFVAKLSTAGVRQWHTFMGSSNYDQGSDIAVDNSNNIYVTGDSRSTWGTPANSHAGSSSQDAFAAKLNSAGELKWNTFMGSTDYDSGRGIAVDNSNNVYVSGCSSATWGNPIDDFVDHEDSFIVKFNNIFLQGIIIPLLLN